jgi:hypothetical protein
VSPTLAGQPFMIEKYDHTNLNNQFDEFIEGRYLTTTDLPNLLESKECP